MAVYTVLEAKEIERFIAPFGIGPLVEFAGITSGIENTNYFLTTDQSDFGSEFQTEALQHYILTIFEALSPQELAFYVELTTLLNLRGLPVPCPLTDSDGVALHSLQGKPALLVPKLAGDHPEQPTVQQCHEIGFNLANIHRACLDAGLEHQRCCSLRSLAEDADAIASQLDDDDRVLLAEIGKLSALASTHSNLPQTVIHGDLFRDNTIFQGDRLIGIIDFYSAGSGYLILDIAITVNDWCSQADGSLNTALCDALLAGYQQARSLTDDEKTLWNDFLRVAAIRFWVSRLTTELKPAPAYRRGGLVEFKDPQQYKNILMQRLQTSHNIN